MRPVLRLTLLLALFAAIGAALLVCAYADRHGHVSDLSRSARNTLDASSVAVLEQLGGAVEAIAYVPNDPGLRRAIGEFFARYQRHKPDFHVRFVDPRVAFERARDDGARLGEIVFQRGAQRERITQLDESTTTNALARLARGAARYVTFLAGNGERRVARQANHDLSTFAAYLEQRGMQVREFSLGTMTTIPANTAVLVIAAPVHAYPPGDLDAINRYLAEGGNLLWFSEPEHSTELNALARSLGVEHLPGTVVDPVGLTRFRNPAYAVVSSHDEHPALHGFAETVVLPFAAALLPTANIGWQTRILARTGDEAWTETGPFEGNVGFDGDDEVQGALVLGVALSRSPGGEQQQKVVVLGDADFLSNAFVDNLGNREFGRRLFEWLAYDDALIDVEVAAVADADLDLEMWQRLMIFVVFALGVPIALTANGALYWWRRRHA